ncbi:MAG: DUF4214 domain-containing protein [Acetobacteraceae bacterium]|nr:DUF4214 domain-containing protein [Acetobacteraceae bacterium]
MAVLVFQADPWTAGPPDAAEYGDPAWFRFGPDAGLFGPLAWSTEAERGFDWTDLAFFTKYVHMLRLTALDGTGFTADLGAYGDGASVVAVTGQGFEYLWPWPGASAGPSLTGGTVSGFSGTIQGRASFSITGLSVPVESLKAFASRMDAAALVEANDLLLAGDDLIVGSGRDDALRGGPGDDSLVGGAGDDVLDGGAGRDTVDMGDTGFRGAGVSASGGVLTVTSAAGTDTLANVEVVTFADGRLVFATDDPAAQVVRLYEAALDRTPEQGGLNFWIDAVQHGRPLAELAQCFLDSAEFHARFGDTTGTNGAFVDRLYHNVLGREGDIQGYAYWSKAVGYGMGRADVLAAFSESAENKAATAALVQNGIWDRSEAAAGVASLYDTVFDRLPDAPGLAFWKEAIEAGRANLFDIGSAFLDSAEARGRYGHASNRDFVDAMYINALGHQADQVDLDRWVNYFNGKLATRTAVVLKLSESAEHAALTAADIQSENPGEFGVLFA